METRDFRILTGRGGYRVSELLDRPRELFAGTPSVGLVIGTFAAVPYVHLQLEARRRFYPDIPALVHDDASPNQDALRRLCEEYGCEFECNDSRRSSNIGDISCFLGGLLWADREGLDLVVKLSRRFLPLVDWVPGLKSLAMDSHYPTYSNHTETYRYGFRTECVAIAVRPWMDLRMHQELGAIALDAEDPFVEGVVHNLARRVARFRCTEARQWERRHGARPADRDGYAAWDFMGTDRCTRSPQFLWHNSATPQDYHCYAELWGLPYDAHAFLDPDQGCGKP